MDQCIEKVTQFHQHIGASIRQQPSLLPCCPAEAAKISKEVYGMIEHYGKSDKQPSEFLVRFLLAAEELAEWAEAHAKQDLVAAVDAWGDRMFVLVGDAVSCGLPASKVFAEVHRSNMTKLGGDLSESGKGIKSDDFEDPDFGEVLLSDEE